MSSMKSLSRGTWTVWWSSVYKILASHHLSPQTAPPTKFLWQIFFEPKEKETMTLTKMQLQTSNDLESTDNPSPQKHILSHHNYIYISLLPYLTLDYYCSHCQETLLNLISFTCGKQLCSGLLGDKHTLISWKSYSMLYHMCQATD